MMRYDEFPNNYFCKNLMTIANRSNGHPTKAEGEIRHRLATLRCTDFKVWYITLVIKLIVNLAIIRSIC
jgi:hypothetical protein